MQLALPIAGAYLGTTFGWGIASLGLSGGAVGWALGGLLSSYLFAPSMPNQEGPRLSDKSVQGSAYGTFIPITYGTIRIAGNIIWSTDLIEKKKKHKSGGGKGGGGGGGSYTTYSYYANFAVQLCEGEITGIGRIWADGQLIMDFRDTALGAISSTAYKFRVYTGSEDQLPDPLIESIQGVGQTPAYRGAAYIVFEAMPLEKFGNRIPNLTFEVMRGPKYMAAVKSTAPGSTLLKTPYYDRIIVAARRETDIGQIAVLACDLYTGQVLDTSKYFDALSPNTISIVPVFDPIFDIVVGIELWVGGTGGSETNKSIFILDPDTLSFEGSYAGTGGDTFSHGYLVYNPVERNLWNFPTTTLGGSVHFIDPVSRTLQLGSMNAVCDGDFIHDHIEICPGRDWADVTSKAGSNRWRLLVTGAHNFIELYSYESGHRVGKVTFPHFLSTDSQGLIMEYDQVRGLVYVTSKATYTDLVIYAMDPWAETAVEVATLPEHSTVIDYMVYSELTGTLLVHASTVAYSANVYEYDVDTWEIINTWTQAAGDFNGDVRSMGEYRTLNPEVRPSTSFVWTANDIDQTVFVPPVYSGYRGALVKIPMMTSIQDEAVTLGYIVEDISIRAGLESGDINVTSMTEPVEGYIISRQSNARSSIEPLLIAHFYDAVESE